MSSDFRGEPETASVVSLSLLVLFVWCIAQLFLLSNAEKNIRLLEQRIERLEKR